MKNILSLLALFCILGNSHSVWGMDKGAIGTLSDDSSAAFRNNDASGSGDSETLPPPSAPPLGEENILTTNPNQFPNANNPLPDGIPGNGPAANQVGATVKANVARPNTLVTRGVGLVLFAATSYAAYHTVGKWAEEFAKKRLQIGDDQEDQPEKISPYLLKGIRVISSLSLASMATILWLYVIAPRILRS